MPKESLEDKLRDNIEALLYRLYPQGPHRRDSKGFRFGSKGSLAVTCVGEKKGCYFDHEKKEGGNLLRLIESKEGLNHVEAISWAKKFLNESEGKSVPSHFSTSHFVKSREDNWISLMPPEMFLFFSPHH